MVPRLCTLVAVTFARATDYYIDPSGSNDLQTFDNAISAANPGDTIYVHGGTYNLSSTISITKSGNSVNPIKMIAVPGETPILDFSAQSLSSSNRGLALSTGADWWCIKGLAIEHAGDNGFYTGANYGVFEQMVTRYNRDSGFQIHDSASYNLILNCDSYENYDAPTLGENADGFAAKSPSVGPGNIFRGNRSWGNSDDGFDVYYTVNYGILVDNCWTFDNGIDIWGVGENYQGDGNGFKLGNPGGPSVVVNSLAVDNPHNGMDINGSTAAVKIFNSTSYGNSRNWRFDQPEPAQVLKNNISYQGTNSDNIVPAVSDSFNSWNGGVSLTNDDFESLTRVVNGIDLLKAPRQTDGSLPDLGGFLHLAASSDLIDAGTTISFVFNGITYNVPYNGMAPDLGAYETGVPAPALPGDYNGDDIVDAADYTVWRNNLNTSASLPNDETPGSVDGGDYEVWKSHFGQSLPGSGSASLSAVPEPGSASMIFAAALWLGSCRRERSVGRISMHGCGREGRQANGDVLRAVGERRAVADPFARIADDGLSGVHFEHAALVLDAQECPRERRKFPGTRAAAPARPSRRATSCGRRSPRRAAN